MQQSNTPTQQNTNLQPQQLPPDANFVNFEQFNENQQGLPFPVNLENIYATPQQRQIYFSPPPHTTSQINRTEMPIQTQIPQQPVNEDSPQTQEEQVVGANAPVVFHCCKCRTIVGDTFSFETACKDKKIVCLSGAINVYIGNEPTLSKEGYDAGCTYVILTCKQCGSRLGKVYKTVTQGMDDYRELFCFSTDDIRSYALGSTTLKSPIEQNFPTCKSLKSEITKIQHLIICQKESLNQQIEAQNETNKKIEEMNKKIEELEKIVRIQKAQLEKHSKKIVECAHGIQKVAKRKRKESNTPNKKQKPQNSTQSNEVKQEQ